MLFDKRIAGMLFLFTCHIFIIASISACTEAIYPLPVFQDPPEIVHLEQMLADFNVNPIDAKNKYQSKTYLFPGVKADIVMRSFLQSESVRFRPKEMYRLDNISAGSVVDIIGTVGIVIDNYLYIDKCIYIVIQEAQLPTFRSY